MKFSILGSKVAQNGPKWPKKGQKRVFFKYSRIIYRWKAYEEVMRTFVEKNEIFHFWAQNGPKREQKMSQMGFLLT